MPLWIYKEATVDQRPMPLLAWWAVLLAGVTLGARNHHQLQFTVRKKGVFWIVWSVCMGHHDRNLERLREQ